jgi:hypothetical protein
MLERLARRIGDFTQPFTPSTPEKIESSVVAKWVVATAAEERVRRP